MSFLLNAVMAPWEFINNFYLKYKSIIHFNKNILIAAVITAILDVVIVVYVSAIYSHNSLLISMISLVADFAIFNSTFVFMFYLSNRHRYFNDDGMFDNRKLRQESVKLVTTLGISEIIYLFTKFTFTYLFFSYSIVDSSQISIITTVLAWILYIVTANIMIKRTKFL